MRQLLPIVHKNLVYRLTTDFEYGYPNGLFWCSITEIHRGRHLRLPRDAYLITLKVDVTCAYANKNEEQPQAY